MKSTKGDSGHVGEPNIVYIEFKCRVGGRAEFPLDSNTPAVGAHGVRFGISASGRGEGGLPWKQVHVGLQTAGDVGNKGLTAPTSPSRPDKQA